MAALIYNALTIVLLLALAWRLYRIGLARDANSVLETDDSHGVPADCENRGAGVFCGVR